eukprot:362640-Chlamydomonas_euryale.AAC.4
MDGVTTREQLLARLVERLCKRPRPTDKEFGSSAALSARLSEMAELGTDVLVLIDDCEGLSAGPAAAGDERSVRLAGGVRLVGCGARWGSAVVGSARALWCAHVVAGGLRLRWLAVCKGAEGRGRTVWEMARAGWI